VPALLAAGVTENQITTMMVDNPPSLLHSDSPTRTCRTADTTVDSAACPA
jgi:hypothetical protein